jgi:hypothetical protein
VVDRVLEDGGGGGPPGQVRRDRHVLDPGGRPSQGLGGAVLEELEFNSATHRYRAHLRVAERMRLEEVDQIVVNAGFGPDDSLYRELQVHECHSSRAPYNLAAALDAAGDCLTAPAVGADVLANPEPDFWILGHKSYGRNPHFLLQTGYRQAADVIDALSSTLAAGAPR